MRIFKRLKTLRFLIVLCVLNMILSFLLVPVDGASDSMWSEYYQEEELDTIFVGSSISSTTFDPQIFNETLGVKSFNRGTPAQAIAQSIDALEVAFTEHEIQTVIFSAGFSTLQVEQLEAAEMSFAMGRANGKVGADALVETVRYVMSEEIIKTENALFYYSGRLESKPLEESEELMELCVKNSVDLVVVNTPHSVHDVVVCYANYEKMSEIVKELCKKHNVEYYDFSLVKPELFEYKTEYFHDCEHLNHQGAQEFCKMLGEFLQKRKRGENMEQYFYSVDEYYAIHDELLEEWIERSETL